MYQILKICANGKNKRVKVTSASQFLKMPRRNLLLLLVAGLVMVLSQPAAARSREAVSRFGEHDSADTDCKSLWQGLHAGLDPLCFGCHRCTCCAGEPGEPIPSPFPLMRPSFEARSTDRDYIASPPPPHHSHIYQLDVSRGWWRMRGLNLLVSQSRGLFLPVPPIPFSLSACLSLVDTTVGQRAYAWCRRARIKVVRYHRSESCSIPMRKSNFNFRTRVVAACRESGRAMGACSGRVYIGAMLVVVGGREQC